MTRKRIFALITIAAMCIAVLAGCNGGSKSDSNYTSAPSANYKSESAGMTAGDSYGYYDDVYEMADNGNSDINYSGSTSKGDTDYYDNNGQEATARKLIKRVNMTLETLEFEKSCNMIEQCVGQFRGYIESSSIRNNDYVSTYYNTYSNRTASYTIRIPNELVDEFVSATGNIGSILSSSSSTEDITLGYLDVESRAKALEIQQERLLALLEQATSVDEIISLEDRISQVTYELESKESILRNYDNLVSYSTVTIALNEVKEITEVVPEPETMGERIARGFTDSIEDITEGLKNFVVWFVVNIPYIIIFLIIIAIATLIVIGLVRLFKKICIKKYEHDQKKFLAKQQKARANEAAASQTAGASDPEAKFDIMTGKPINQDKK